MSWYSWDGPDLVLTLLVQPRSARDEFIGPQGEAYKVRITAPPVDGRANLHLIKFLANAFGVKNKAVSLVIGTNSRHKIVRINGPTLLPLPVPQRGGI